jgi:hypothetical protein
MPSWSIGHSERERLEVALLSSPAAEEGYDWVPARAHVAVGGFQGSTDLTIMASDMKRFHAAVESMYRRLKGEAEFTTLEDQLYIKVTVDALGHVQATGYLKDDASFGNRLCFQIAFDQSLLGRTVRELEQALAELCGGGG